MPMELSYDEIFSGEICVDLFVINSCCVAEVSLSEMTFKTFPRCLLLCFCVLAATPLPIR